MNMPLAATISSALATPECTSNDTRVAAESFGGLTRDRPVLLVTDQAWDAGGGGAVILRSLLKGSLGNGVVWATPSRASQNSELGQYGLAQGSMGRLGRQSTILDSVLYAGSLAREALALADDLKASAVWMVLHGSVVHVARHLARSSRLPLHVTIHDDPAYATALRSRRYLAFIPLINRSMRAILKRASSIDVVSERMAERYASIYGVKCVTVHRGLSDKVSPTAEYDFGRHGLTVGVLGCTYALAQLQVLVQALERASRAVGLPARLIVCGGGSDGERLAQQFAGRIEIVPTGHLAEPEAITRLRQCFLLYLNYPFGWRDKVLRETSFPTKLSTYVYAARPILVHAPVGSSLSGLPIDRGFTTPWTSMNADDGARLIAGLVRVPHMAGSFHLEAEVTRRTYYDYGTHYATMSDVLRRLTASSRLRSNR